MTSYRDGIAQSRLNIYEQVGQSLYIPTDELEMMLSDSLVGLPLGGYALRTRSKVVKAEICKALGYPIPVKFKKSHPRFPGQNFDVYTQKGRVIQIWNEEIDPGRRYVLLHVNPDDVIEKVKVITGEELTAWDTTGRLTSKYQAKMISYGSSCLLSDDDTPSVSECVCKSAQNLSQVNPNSMPSRSQLLGIRDLFHCLLPLAGQYVSYINAVQERNRSAELHEMICRRLGYSVYEDNGSYPDIVNQLLEIKLQTSPTIDLGLHSPEDSAEIVSSEDTVFHSQDIRYAVFEGEVQNQRILIKDLYLVTGQDFTKYFPLFKGKHSKIQLPIPTGFFD